MWLFAAGLIALLALYAVRRRTRALTFVRLQHAIRVLGSTLGQGEFEGIDEGKIVLRLDDKLVRLDILKTLDVIENCEPQFRRERLLWLVRQSEMRPVGDAKT